MQRPPRTQRVQALPVIRRPLGVNRRVGCVFSLTPLLFSPWGPSSMDLVTCSPFRPFRPWCLICGWLYIAIASKPKLDSDKILQNSISDER